MKDTEGSSFEEPRPSSAPAEPAGLFRPDMHTLYPVRNRANRLAIMVIGVVIGAGLCYLAFVIAAIWFPALAHAPEDTDPANAPWFRSLSQPGLYGGSCCKESDCHVTTTVEIREGTYYVQDPDVTGRTEWLPVNPERILKRYDNPTGKYVACVFNHTVLCFVLVEGI